MAGAGKILLYGPEGCGKSLFAGAMFNEMKGGQGSWQAVELKKETVLREPEKLDSTFKKIISLQVQGLLIEDVDELFRGLKASPGEHRRFLENFRQSDELFIIATARNPEWLSQDELELFESLVPILFPNASDRKDILRVQTRGVKLDASIRPEEVAEATAWWSGKEIKLLIDRAGQNGFISRESLFENIDRINSDIVVEPRAARMRELLKFTDGYCRPEALRTDTLIKYFNLFDDGVSNRGQVEGRRPRGEGEAARPPQGESGRVDFDVHELAEAYGRISGINPPAPVSNGLFEFNDLVLLRTVDPRQHIYLEALARRHGADSEWERIRAAVAEQRELRQKLYRWVSALDDEYREDGANFIFPDPISLLLWIWTFQLFQTSYTRGLEETDKKFFFRGEARDFGATRFLPNITRPSYAHYPRDKSTPQRIRELLRQHLSADHSWGDSEQERRRGLHLIETMSCAQALAVAQHYGYPTPLLDVTIHPEIALYFATLSSEAEVGVVGYWDVYEVDAIEGAKNLALIVAPPMFSRIHIQSGYFICTTDADHKLKTPFRTLVFKHRPELEPLFPTWVMSLGPVRRESHGSDLILADPFDLSSGFKGPLPEPPSDATFLDPGVVVEIADGEFVRRAATDMFCATGQQRINADGVRVNVIQPGLLYVLHRYAPDHCFIFAAAFAANSEAEADKRLYKILADANLNVMRGMLISVLADEFDKDRARDTVLALQAKELLQNMWRLLHSGDNNAIPWPLNSWYS